MLLQQGSMCDQDCLGLSFRVPCEESGLYALKETYQGNLANQSVTQLPHAGTNVSGESKSGSESMAKKKTPQLVVCQADLM